MSPTSAHVVANPMKGRVGMIGLIATESAFFATFIVTYLFYVGKSLVGPHPREVLEPPILASVCLLTSSVTIWLASRALGRARMGTFRLWLMSTIALGAVFLAETAREWHDLIVVHGLTIRTNLFGSTYYSLVGFHALHVAVGLMLLSLVLVLALRGHVRRHDHERVEMLSWYWHFVDTVWIAVFAAVYVVGR